MHISLTNLYLNLKTQINIYIYMLQKFVYYVVNMILIAFIFMLFRVNLYIFVAKKNHKILGISNNVIESLKQQND